MLPSHASGQNQILLNGKYIRKKRKNHISCVCTRAASVVSNSLRPSELACQLPLSTGFSRQEYWSELLGPPPGDLPNPGTEPRSLTSPVLADVFFTTGATCQCI